MGTKIRVTKCKNVSGEIDEPVTGMIEDFLKTPVEPRTGLIYVADTDGSAYIWSKRWGWEFRSGALEAV